MAISADDRLAELREQVTGARAAYEGGTWDGVAEQPVPHDDPEAAALYGSLLTVTALARSAKGQDATADFQAAVSAFTAAGDEIARSVEHVADYGCALVLAGEPGPAESVLWRALNLGADTADVWRCYALVVREEGDQAQVRRLLVDASARFPDDWQLAVELAQIAHDAGPDDAERTDAWVRAGYAVARAGLWDRVVSTVSRQEGADGVLLVSRARLQLAAGYVDHAIESLNAAAGLGDPRQTPGLVPVLVNLAGALMDEIDRHPDGRDAALAEAIGVADAALLLEPDHALAMAYRGELRRRRAELTEAEEDFSRAAGLDPRNSFVWAAFGLVRRDQLRRDEAVEYLERAAALAPDTTWIRLEAAQAWYDRAESGTADSRQDDVRRALEHLDAAAGLEPENPRVWTLTAYAQWFRADVDASALAVSEQALRRVLELAPDTPGVTVDLARVLYRRRAYAEALQLVEDLEPDIETAPAVILLRGRIHAMMEDAPGALPDLEAAVAALPESAEAHAALGDAYRMLERFDEAVAELDIALTMTPDDSWALGSRGAARLGLRQEGTIEAAAADLRRAVDLDPTDSWSLRHLRDALDQLGPPAEVARELSALARRVPDEPDIQEIYADALLTADQATEAIEVAERTLARYPEHIGLLRSLGWSYLATGDNARALDALERAAAIQPDATVLRDLAQIQSSCDLVPDALATVDRGLALGPHAGLLSLRSAILSGLADWPGAVEAAEAAIAAGTPDAGMYLNLGWALENTDDRRQAEALEAYRTASRLDENDPMALRGIADCLWRLGERDEAARTYEETLARFQAAQPAQDSNVGWCLFRLGRHPEAAEAYLRSLPEADSRVSLLFDIGLNWLAAGEPARGGEAYAQGFADARNRNRSGLRGMLAVGVRDLHDAIEGGQIAESEQTRSLMAQLTATLDNTAALTRR